MKLNRRQVLKTTAALGASGVMLGGLRRSAFAAADEVVIGASIPLTGVFAFAGVGVNDGIQDYVKLINESGGVAGRNLSKPEKRQRHRRVHMRARSSAERRIDNRNRRQSHGEAQRDTGEHGAHAGERRR